MRRVAALFLAVALVLMPCALAVGEDVRVIRVAFPVQAGMTEVDEAGNYAGYVYEYLEELAQYTGWEYELVQVPGDVNEGMLTLLNMVETGEVDLVGGLLYSDAMAEMYDYVGYSMGTVYTTLATLAEDTSPWIFDGAAGQKVRVAVQQTGGPRIEELMSYCTMNRIEPQLVLCDTQAAQIEAMREGRADMMLNVSLNQTEGVRDMARFAPRPFYFAVTKGRQDLVSAVNTAIYTLEQTDPYFTTQLHEKYFSNKADLLVLTEQERAYIATVDHLRVGVLRDSPPYQYLARDGQMGGISIDLLDVISQAAGLSFQLVQAENPADLSALAAAGQVDILAGMTYDYSNAQRENATMTRPYVSMQYMLMVNQEINESDLSGKQLAMPEHAAYQGYFLGEPEFYPTQESCIRAVADGRAGYTYADAYVAQYYVNQPDYSNLRLTPLNYESHQSCLGVVKPAAPELLSILNKCILTVSTETMQRIVYQNTTVPVEVTLSGWLKANPMQGLAVVTVVLLSVIGALAWGFSVRGRMNRKISMDMEKYTQLYEMASERFFEYDFTTNQLMLTMEDTAGGGTGMKLLRYDLLALQIDQENDAGALAEFLRTREDGVREERFLCPDGERHWLRFTTKTIHDGDRPAVVIGKITEIDEERQEKESLLYKAQHDGLTDLFNAEVCRQKITGYLGRLAPGARGALLLMDVDYFKSINDGYGHLEGDRVLRRVADLLRELFRGEDVLGRPGGDEFAVYMSGVRSAHAVQAKGDALCKRLHSVGFPDGGHITCSIGAAWATQGVAYEDVYRRADALLYEAKAQGRDRCILEEPPKEHSAIFSKKSLC